MADLRGRIVHRLSGLLRPIVTLGARCMVIDRAGRTVLVRHTYSAGWHFPGGGVDPGETAAAAALRETREETGLSLSGSPEFVGLYFNEALARRDHVAFFAMRDVPHIADGSLKPAAMEIAEAILVHPDDLPADATSATRRRIDEVLGGAARSETW